MAHPQAAHYYPDHTLKLQSGQLDITAKQSRPMVGELKSEKLQIRNFNRSFIKPSYRIEAVVSGIENTASIHTMHTSTKSFSFYACTNRMHILHRSERQFT